jgi:hypothetical protein
LRRAERFSPLSYPRTEVLEQANPNLFDTKLNLKPAKMTNINMINELNNNSIFPAANGKKKQLPDSVINSKTDIGRIPGLYKNDDGYRPYTIYSGEFCPFRHKHFFFWFLDPFSFLLGFFPPRNWHDENYFYVRSSRVSCLAPISLNA